MHAVARRRRKRHRGDVTDDLQRLHTKFERGALVHPARGASSLVDLAGAVWTAAGVEGLPLTDGGRELLGRIGAPRHLVLVVADGLGLDLLESMPAASYLWQHLAGALHTVFPSTTAVALTSIYSATWPGVHGITGHWMAGPGDVGPITVLPYTRRSDRADITSLGVATDEVFRAPALPGLGGRASLFALPERLLTGGFTDYSCGTAQRYGYHSLTDGIDAIASFVRAADGPTMSVLYSPRIDDAAHEHGPMHMEVVGAVRALDTEISRLVAMIEGRDARVVLTADHGHLVVTTGNAAVLRGDDEVGRHLRTAPTGDARGAYVHVDREANPDVFAAAFRAHYDERFALLTPTEVIDAGLLGPVVTDVTRTRLGDFVAISLGEAILEYRPAGGRADPRLQLRSQHSGLSSAEMRVPFVLA
jgi:hypothetical protein